MRKLIVAALLVAASAAAAHDYVAVPGGTFTTALRYEDAPDAVRVEPFRMMTRPVTNAEFLAFVKAQPQWQRGNVATVFAGAGYLEHWPAPARLDPAQRDLPVTRVSWFAASAYCAAGGGRLPLWLEWEYAAAADATRKDARNDPAWRERILGWYARPASTPLPRAGASAPNVYGLRDLHGVVWEWVDDHGAMLVDADSRNQGDGARGRFCGAGALSANDRSNYAVLMRVAMLSSLEAADSTTSLGFRCVKEMQ
jgi:formylglycine-generating enzyme required for sulfatase activity